MTDAIKPKAGAPVPPTQQKPEIAAPARPPTSPARILRPYLRGGEAAELIGVSIRTLEKYRCTGGGPPFLKVGSRVLYLREDVEAWLQRHRCQNTSDDNYAAALREMPSRRNRP
ncbi:helix-turn-helix domain-containing protein [Komagataeibacter oboediens]|uniref:helix-turn-helix domain-containing protein n=1 Tax=Komagataeibacter oboediens TaxID=65958 RepID=UPI001C2C9A46|nr:helix-turn-helix domain-containing protein [Komagataeibacter oboediens]MBV0888863.1 helix-turn-helix domain-containing protein [Komagataeibacter oboediens]MCK9821491.1 helix-turn-helix domain-containing protein [Komagataeibacter oboediens]